MTPFSLQAPFGSVSFGQVSTAITRELFKRGFSGPIFPIGQPDLSTQKPDPEFNARLQSCINSSQARHSRANRSVRLWHIVGSLESLSSQGNDLITFFELDQLTPTEINILKQQRKVYVTSRYTQTVFTQYGIQSTYLPLGFDSYGFQTIEPRPKIDGVLQSLLAGKLENRKAHMRVLNLWAKRYGNQKGYRLNCALHNPFLKPEDANQLIARALEGKQYWNINWIPWSPTNAEYNSVLQSSEIVISCSGGEGRDLPCYHATALGAWPIALRAHAYLDYLTDENAILVNPNGKAPATDGVFFHRGQGINEGNLFTFADEDFYAACDEAEKRANQGVNLKGMELQKQTYKETVDALLAGLES